MFPRLRNFIFRNRYNLAVFTLLNLSCAICIALVGARVAGGSRVIFPPQSVCEVSFRETDDLVDVGPGGIIRTFTIVHTKWGGLATPYIIVFVQLDGASTATGGYLRNVSTDPTGSLSLIGARCRAVFKDEPAGEWSDFWFELEE